MAEPTFEELLDKRAADVEAPKPLPEGPYYTRIADQTMREAGEKKTKICSYALEVLEALEGVDENRLAEFGDLSDATLRADFFLTKRALYRLTDWWNEVLNIKDGGRTIKEMLPDPVGQYVVAYVTQRPSGRAGDDTIYNDVSGWAAPKQFGK